MNKKFKNLLLIDSSYMLHRSLKVPDIFKLSNDDGQKIGAISQFFKSLNFEVKRNVKYFPVAVWDCGLSERRVKLYPDYKKRDPQRHVTHRKDDISAEDYYEAYCSQRDILIEMLKSFGIPSIRIDGWEADDLIYVVSTLTDDAVIVSDDRDYYQLVSENVKVARPLAGEMITEDGLLDDGYTPELYLITKCIVGDKSDNIPNVARGLGDKNAYRLAKIIYKNPNNYLDIISESDKKVDQAFVENHDQFLLNKKLIDLKEVDAEIDGDFLRIVSNEVVSTMGKQEYFKALEWVGSFRIKGIDVDEILTTLTFPKKHFFD